MLKNLPANAGEMGSIPGSGRSPGGGNGYPSTPLFLPEKSRGQRSLAGQVHGVPGVGHVLSDITTTIATATSTAVFPRW